MRQFFRPSRRKIIVAILIPFLSLFLFFVLYGAPPIGLKLCGGAMEENGQIVYYDYPCIEVPYTISNLLSHFVPTYIFVCYSTWAWDKIKGIEHRRKRVAVRGTFILSLPLLLLLLPFVVLLLVSVVKPDYFPAGFCQSPLPPWIATI